MKNRKHLDLGCGSNPRNPFFAENVYGIDIGDRSKLYSQTNVTYVDCNLIFNKIPYPDNYFDSVSAYDFFEHVPRVMYIDGGTCLPYINLMSEIFRVLKSGGRLLAITPYYPMESAFVDPTHVNFISKNTYKYFTQPHVWAKMYGFVGQFSINKVKIVNFDTVVNTTTPIKSFIKEIFNLIYPKRKQHVLWDFNALK
jgi:SAM-dependent methyltransferase